MPYFFLNPLFGTDSLNLPLFLSSFTLVLTLTSKSEVNIRRKCSSLLLELFHGLPLKPHLSTWVWEWFQQLVDCSVKSHHWGLMLPFLFIKCLWVPGHQGMEGCTEGKRTCCWGISCRLAARGSFEQDKPERGSQQIS